MKILLLVLGLLTSVVIDSNKIRFGELQNFKEERNDAVAVVKSKEVYFCIEEYKQIKEEGIKPGSARYTQLMAACTKKYRSGLRKAASGTYVLVIEEGGISGYPVTDITKQVIEQL